MPLRALIFDVDGTLADTERDAHRVAFNQAFAAADLPFDWDVPTYGYYLKVTGGKERLRSFLNDHPEYPQLGDADIARIHKQKTGFYVEMMEAGLLPLRPGVERLLNVAREVGLPIAIATTTTPANVESLLKSTLGKDGPGRFRTIGAGDIVPHKKPAPDIYLYVLQQLGFPAPDCLALEDSENGLRSAASAGLATVITQTEYTQHQNFSAALRVLDQLGEPQAPAQILQGREAGARVVVDVDLLTQWWEEKTQH